MVRAGVKTILIDDFERLNVVAVGWGLGDLTNKTPNEIKELVNEHYSEKSSQSKGKIAANEIKFRHEIKKGDYVLSYDSWTHHYLLGKIASDYYYNPSLVGEDNPDIRNVEWLYKIPKDKLKESTQNSLGTHITVFRIRDDVKEDILNSCENKPIQPPFESELKRNLIYFGAPGTGKSYNLNQDKYKLLENYEDNYERVTFHPDYSYANFVGTYKPVPENDSITYKYVPGPFMRILKKAIQKPSEPHLLIIEEINRANVAAVFGDVFQLLDRDENNESRYPIDTTEDMKSYINQDKIKIPQNLFIWATMNSADQGVFPMDTAFKRRWDFNYFSINNNEDLIGNINVSLNDIDINWNILRKAINDELLSYKINEDKLMGPFFAFHEFKDKELPVDSFKDIFKNKIIMYLFEDAARAKRNDLFSGAKTTNYVTYSQICEKFDEDGIEIFCDSIKSKFISDDE